MGVGALNLMKETFFYYRATLCKPSETLYLALWDLPLEIPSRQLPDLVCFNRRT
jgi:hypothetical protein